MHEIDSFFLGKVKLTPIGELVSQTKAHPFAGELDGPLVLTISYLYIKNENQNWFNPQSLILNRKC